MKFTLSEVKVIQEFFKYVLTLEDYEYEDIDGIKKILVRIDMVITLLKALKAEDTMKFTLKELGTIKDVLTDVLAIEYYEYEDTEEIVNILDRIDEETNLD